MTENNSSQSTTSRPMMRIFTYGASALIGVFVLMQFGRFVIPEFKLDNPPVTHTVNWDSPETERLWTAACADCHSNETIYPWYSYVAPVGFLVARDTHEGRRKLNVSENNMGELDEVSEVVHEGEMPMPIYTIMHPEARLSDAERQALVNGLEISLSRRNNNGTADAATNNGVVDSGSTASATDAGDNDGDDD